MVDFLYISRPVLEYCILFASGDAAHCDHHCLHAITQELVNWRRFSSTWEVADKLSCKNVTDQLFMQTQDQIYHYSVSVTSENESHNIKKKRKRF